MEYLLLKSKKKCLVTAVLFFLLNAKSNDETVAGIFNMLSQIFQ